MRRTAPHCFADNVSLIFDVFLLWGKEYAWDRIASGFDRYRSRIAEIVIANSHCILLGKKFPVNGQIASVDIAFEALLKKILCVAEIELCERGRWSFNSFICIL